jgi:hypothetical protein
MTYQFDPVHAENYGVDEAIMLHHLIFWIKRNHAEKRNLFEGKAWVYYSHKKLSEVFKFWSPKQVRRILKSLVAQGVVLESHHGEMKVDQTKWYSVNLSLFSSEPPENSPIAQMGNCNLPNGKLQLTEREIAIDQTGNCNNRKQIINNNNKNTDTAWKFFLNSNSQWLDSFLMAFKSQIDDFDYFGTQAEAKLEEEGLEHDHKKIYWRLKRFASSWIQNRNRESFAVKQPEKTMNSNPYRGNSF